MVYGGACARAPLNCWSQSTTIRLHSGQRAYLSRFEVNKWLCELLLLDHTEATLHTAVGLSACLFGLTQMLLWRTNHRDYFRCDIIMVYVIVRAELVPSEIGTNLLS